jgi:23S rRNA (cytidine1920-2'-O)/16S rRNA (cytidine1409-2'-O)-methyltransferase
VKTKIRLDQLLLERKLAKNINEATALVMTGQVKVNDKTLTKPGTQVDTLSEISIAKQNPYVSRGGLKLEPAIKHFNIALNDKICMDIGASTGGFTDCMLQSGAKKVYAVDVGKNLLAERLRKDLRVINIEEANFRYFSTENLKEKPEFVTIDVSFISLEKILPALLNIISENSLILALVKPQFEAGPGETVKGVVKDKDIRNRTIEKIKAFAVKINLKVLGGVDSTVKGPKGNIEHFLLLEKM